MKQIAGQAREPVFCDRWRPPTFGKTHSHTFDSSQLLMHIKREDNVLVPNSAESQTVFGAPTANQVQEQDNKETAAVQEALAKQAQKPASAKKSTVLKDCKNYTPKLYSMTSKKPAQKPVAAEKKPEEPVKEDEVVAATKDGEEENAIPNTFAGITKSEKSDWAVVEPENNQAAVKIEDKHDKEYNLQLEKQLVRRERFALNDPCKQRTTHELTKYMDNRAEAAKWQTESSLYRGYDPASSAPERKKVYKNESQLFKY